jgi:hypothetical protein
MLAFGESSWHLTSFATIDRMAEQTMDNPAPETIGKQIPSGSSLAVSYHLVRFILGFAVCFWLWAKWLFSPRMFFLPPLPPVEVLISLVERVLGLWLVALIPLWGAVLVGLDGLESRRAERLGWWARRLLRGAAEVVVVHLVVWVVGSVLFFVLLTLLPGSDVRGRAMSDPVVQGLILFCAFLSLIVAGPISAIIVAVRGQGSRRRDGFPPTRLGALNHTWAVLLVPLLVLWIASGYPREILRPFMQGGGATAKEASFALVSAAREGEAESVRALLRHGAQVNAKDDSGATALLAAASNGHGETVQLLISAGADVNARNNIGRTALLSAAANRYAEIVRTLMKAGADVNAKDEDGKTALLLAASAGHAEITQLLIQAEADVNATSASGDTALMAAARGGHTEVVRLLANAGSKLEAKDKRGNSALKMAAGSKHTETVRALREAGAKD